jgi:hypothetical protein
MVTKVKTKSLTPLSFSGLGVDLFAKSVRRPSSMRQLSCNRAHHNGPSIGEGSFA